MEGIWFDTFNLYNKYMSIESLTELLTIATEDGDKLEFGNYDIEYNNERNKAIRFINALCFYIQNGFSTFPSGGYEFEYYIEAISRKFR